MRTTITIDDGIFGELMRFTGAETRTEAINRALSEWLRRKKIEQLKALRGKIRFDADTDELRRLEIEEAQSLHG